ncbi:MAG: ASCH domain-containing protein [Bacteroidales bacterium]|nr:ASCH domain-containing protein [Bacteroidales bacterium]
MIEEEIRVLAVRQPFADGIINGLKTIEIRSKPTKTRGRIAIYASGNRYKEREIDDIVGNFYYLKDLKMMTSKDYEFISQSIYHGPVGKIIGTVELYYSSAIPVCDSGSFDFYSKEHLAPITYYKKGKTYFWGLRSPIKFSEPIPYKPPKGAVVWSKTVLPDGY